MDYSIYDAIRAGFKKVVFIIRKEFAEDFKDIFEPQLKGKIEIDYVFQDLNAFAGGHTGSGRPYQTLGNRACCTLRQR